MKCDKCEKRIDGKPCECFCGGNLCWPCYRPHIEGHASVAVDDEPEDAYIDDCIEMIVS